MSSISAALGKSFVNHPLKDAFLRWQCRVRQIAMRDNAGRPDDSFMPDIFLNGEEEVYGSVITLLNKAPAHSLTAEMKFMAEKTHDPAQRREQAMTFLSSTYYQKHREFSDILTATFQPDSAGAKEIRAAKSCVLKFAAYGQTFDLSCKVWRLAGHNPLFAATIAHNRLFNPTLHPDTIVLGFEPNWDASSSDPSFSR